VRDKQIDLLRFIGLSFLILGHVEPPGWLFQLRNFNVPLVVMASAMAMTHAHLTGEYFDYVWKRLRRLAFPAWLFLTLYFPFLWLTGLAPKLLTPLNIWNNYSFSNDGGFMWIIRIFLLVALTAPFVYKLDQKVRSNKLYLGSLLLAYVLYEGLLYFLNACPSSIWVDYTIGFIGYAIGYGLVYALGLRLARLTSGEVWLVGGFSLFVFIVLGVIYYFTQGHVVSTQHYKYPPQAYYVSYALAVSMVLYKYVKFMCACLSRWPWAEWVVMFTGQNTLWVYLWHTIFLFIGYRMPDQGFLVRYLIVYSLSVLTVYLQVTAVRTWLLPQIASESARKDVKALLTG
jgi:fucose 4-O-acetylase-like acetyltransferase